MDIDSRIRNAIFVAASKGHQPNELANKLVAWFNALASGNEDIANPQHSVPQLELTYGAVVLDSPSERTGPDTLDNKDTGPLSGRGDDD